MVRPVLTRQPTLPWHPARFKASKRGVASGATPCVLRVRWPRCAGAGGRSQLAPVRPERGVRRPRRLGELPDHLPQHVRARRCQGLLGLRATNRHIVTCGDFAALLLNHFEGSQVAVSLHSDTPDFGNESHQDRLPPTPLPLARTSKCNTRHTEITLPLGHKPGLQYRATRRVKT
jgi:hypothetical protein